jgi:hypothetical protein
LAKSKSGYKRGGYYQPPEGIQIPVSAGTFDRLKAVTIANISGIPARSRTPIRLAVGYYCESHLWKALDDRMVYPLPKPGSPDGKPATHFEISETLHLGIEKFAAEKGRSVRDWIGGVVFHALGIEERRQKGLAVEHEWRERHRI